MKLIISLFMIVLVGLIGTLLIGPQYVNWENQHEIIAKQIARVAGMPNANISGPVVIKTFPSIKIEIAKIDFNPHQGEEKIAVIQDFKTEMSWGNILRFNLQPTYVKASSINVNLIQIDEENANYQPKRQSRRIRANTPASLFPLSGLGDVKIDNINIKIQNNVKDITTQISTEILSVQGKDLKNTQINLAGFYNEHPYSVQGSLDLSSLRQIPVNLDLTLAETRLSLEGIIYDPLLTPLYSGDVALNIPNLTQPFEILKVASPSILSKGKAFSNLTFRSNVLMSETKISLDDIAFQLNLPNDQENEEKLRREIITGNILYSLPTSQASAALNAKIYAENLNLDNFFASDASKKKEDERNEAVSKWSESPFDLSPLSQLDLDVQFEAKKALLRGMTYDALKARLKNSNGTLMLEELSAESDGGIARLSGVFNHGQANPSIDGRIRTRNLPLSSLFPEGLNKRFAGRVTSSFDIETQGISEFELVKNLNGKGEIQVTDGALLGIRLDDMMTAMQLIFKKRKDSHQTDFSNMGLTFELKDGTLSNDDFHLHTEKASVLANGKIDFANWTINARIQPQTKTGPTDILVPVRVSGDLSSPTITPMLINSGAGRGAAIGGLIGGPIGAGIGAMIGSQLSKGNKTPEAPEDPLTAKEINKLEDKVEKDLENPLPFKLKNVSPEDVRKFLESDE